MAQSETNRLAYGINQASQATSIGRSLLYEEIRAGRLKSFKLKNRTLIAADDLAIWLDSYRRADA